MSTYYSFIDWFKCIGITLIVVGHVAAAPINHLTAPIYPKQLGVALFIFAMGFSLAHEKRPTREVLIRRLFEIYFWGILCAVLLSIIMFCMKGTINKSNYTPFIAGINVFFDFFPANPTTWFIGTYLHILLLWAFLIRKIRITLPVVILSLAFEVVVRALLIVFAGGYIAYMAFPNWLGVYMAGAYFAQSDSSKSSYTFPKGVACLALLMIFPIAWPRLAGSFILDRAFPFAHFGIGQPIADPLLTSLLVSAWYLAYTVILYMIVRTWNTFHWVRLTARNTILIFILHMPVYYGLEALMHKYTTTYSVRSTIYVIACLPLLAILSEFLRRFLPVSSYLDRLAKSLSQASPILSSNK